MTTEKEREDMMKYKRLSFNDTINLLRGYEQKLFEAINSINDKGERYVDLLLVQDVEFAIKNIIRSYDFTDPYTEHKSRVENYDINSPYRKTMELKGE